MKKRLVSIILAVLTIINCIIMPVTANAPKTLFDGTYEQVMGISWVADNSITFNSKDNTFLMNVNMMEGYFQLNGTYTVNSNQASCMFTDNNEFKGKTFIMTNINGNIVFDADERLITIDPGALFKSQNYQETSKMPWEDAYLDTIKTWQQDNGAFQFSIYDIDEDGTPELFIASYGFYSIFTYKNGQVEFLGTVNDHLFISEKKNSFLTFGGMGSGISGGMLFTIENGQLSEGEIEFYCESNEQATMYVIDGQDVSESEYDLKIKQHTSSENQIYSFICEPYVYIPDETRLSYYETKRNTKPQIKVILDESPLVFDQPPVIDGGRTLVPVRAIFEALGANIIWDAESKTVLAKKGETTIRIQIDNDKMNKNDQEYTLDIPAKIINNRTLVPVRAVSEALSARVSWDADTQTVNITSHEQYVKNFANALWRQLNNQGIDNAISDRITADSDCLKAMLVCKAQAAWNEVTLDVTSAAVNATLTAYGMSHGDINNVQKSIAKIKKTVMKEGSDFASSAIVKALPDVNADDIVWNIANNAKTNNDELYIKFVALHVSTNGQMDYDTSVEYITLFQTLQMNSNSIKMGTNYFKNKLPDGFLESLGTIGCKVLVDFASDKIEILGGNGVYDSVVKKEVLNIWNSLIEINNSDISDWAKENQRLQDQLMDILS